MLTSYNARVWKTTVRKGTRVTTYYVRWGVDGRAFNRSFRKRAQADSFRSELVSAARKGEAFNVNSGLPESMQQADKEISWYEFACDYVDAKWPKSAATTRRTIAEAMTAVTCSMFTTDRGQPDGVQLRSAIKRYAFNTSRRASPDIPDIPEQATQALRWASRHTRPAADLNDPQVLRKILDDLAIRLDGTPRAPSVVSRWRRILHNAVEYAIERKILTTNPIPALKWKPPRTVQAVDRRRVANPSQVRALLTAVDKRAPHLVAFYASLYFAALRPEEAAALAKQSIDGPAEGWGKIHLENAKPHAGSEWTNSGDERDNRQLKQRAIGETRTVPCPPELTALLRRHIKRFGTTADGRLFVGERNTDHLPALSVTRTWAHARESVFGENAGTSHVAARPYDLRHAAVSTWLNAGVPATQVAEWAGHSVDVLLKIYAKCIDGDAARNQAKIDNALGRSIGD
ncbi:tyrosine-type recombinase/integrase [Phytoactinopolyspora alkaliphila]|uniref:Tyrosine-type recombinase/integrase n=2 Tax=Phytoactinopolyspora alkaliphila TaxID=1783498 RepID=A0A6N9YT11_9ACTN|nr:tyrosine-type recombinase/integrase [Phytoactinopolyspora alkaliphila]